MFKKEKQMQNKLEWEKLPRWKYRTKKLFVYETGIKIKFIAIITKYITLERNGRLTIQSRYCWDGASGTTFDTINSMRGSLIHDALYQLMRMGLLGQEYKKQVDNIFHSILIIDGMNKIRARIWYWGVRTRIAGMSCRVQKRVGDE